MRIFSGMDPSRRRPRARQEWDSNIRRRVRRALDDAINAIEMLGDSSENDPIMNKCMQTLQNLRNLRDKINQPRTTP